MTIPVWLVVFLVIFAAIGVLDRVLAPSVRWFFRRKLNTAIDELNNRLDLRIQPFRLTRKQTLVDQLMYDQQVIAAAEKEASTKNTPISVVMAKAERYAKEIVPSFSPFAYFGFGTRLARMLSQFIYRVQLGYSDDESLKSITQDSSVIFVMNHRSNMDYILVTYMASARASLSYAVGEWARIWGLQNVIRALGAYFIRRGSNNDLYRKVLARYVSMATKEGVTQAMFPEGGLSRDGTLGPPKLGLLSYMVADFDPKTSKDVVFIPVGINYDRVMEDRILTRKREEEFTGRSFRVGFGSIMRFVGNAILLRLQGRLYSYGSACVSFGKPVSLSTWSKDNGLNLDALTDKQRHAAIEKLGSDLLTEIARIIPVLPVAVTARVFLNAGDTLLSELELKSLIFKEMSELENSGAHLHIPREDRDYAASMGLRMLTLRHLVETTSEGLYKANPNEQVLLEYYANSIAHLRGKAD
ncbi:MAG: 1-acyl-sn-glycerol-3-phosphate acyltransferase [Pseudomonadota bacterium]